jgi:deoxyribodipyrimidine photo-lyase
LSVSTAPTIVWFRQDLRLQDNPALHAALARGGGVVPLFNLDEEGEGRWRPGGASQWWLHHSLAALGAALRERGSRLILARGDTVEVLRDVVAAVGLGRFIGTDATSPMRWPGTPRSRPSSPRRASTRRVLTGPC